MGSKKQKKSKWYELICYFAKKPQNQTKTGQPHSVFNDNCIKSSVGILTPHYITALVPTGKKIERSHPI